MIDWSDSKTGELEMWKNPLIPVEERLQIADGAIAFRDNIIKNLRERLVSAEKSAKSKLGATTQQSGVVPEGYVLVPIEPTSEMVRIGAQYTVPATTQCAADCWDAMLEALLKDNL